MQEGRQYIRYRINCSYQDINTVIENFLKEHGIKKFNNLHSVNESTNQKYIRYGFNKDILNVEAWVLIDGIEYKLNDQNNPLIKRYLYEIRQLDKQIKNVLESVSKESDSSTSDNNSSYNIDTSRLPYQPGYDPSYGIIDENTFNDDPTNSKFKNKVKQKALKFTNRQVNKQRLKVDKNAKFFGKHIKLFNFIAYAFMLWGILNIFNATWGSLGVYIGNLIVGFAGIKLGKRDLGLRVIVVTVIGFILSLIKLLIFGSSN